MKHNCDDPRITAYVFDELEPAQRAEFETELKSSAELRSLVDQTRSTVDVLRGEFAGDGQPHLREDQRASIRAALAVKSLDAGVSTPRRPESSTGRPARSRRSRWILIAEIGGVAAALLIIATAVFSPGFERLRETARRQQALAESDAASTAASLQEDRAAPSDGDALPAISRVPSIGAAELGASGSGPQSMPIDGSLSLSMSQQQASQLGEQGTPSRTAEPLVTDFTTAVDRVDVRFKQAAPLSGEAAVNYPPANSGAYGGGYGGYVRGGYGGGDGGGYGGAQRDGAQAEQRQLLSEGRGIGGGGLAGGAYVRSNDGAGYSDDYDDYSVGVTFDMPLRDPRGERQSLPADSPDEGRGPGEGGDKYDLIVENDFLRVADAPLSTFSIDVDTASYSKVRQYLNEHQQLPRPDAVRIEELVNYFPYHYEPPAGEDPFAAYIEAATCPWNPEHQLVRIGIKGQEIETEKRPASNLVFLLDVSGSMDEPNKLPLVKEGMAMLTRQLTENDRVAIVVYAGAAGLVLDSTTGDKQPTILAALERLQAGGSTNGGAGIHLAYQLALDHFKPGGTNRVILCTDGDFNVGTTGTDELVRIVQEHAKSDVFLSVLGFGMGNHNDAMLEQISNKGNGNYAFVDTQNEAKKVLVEQLAATLVTIAKDVKIQVEFNPAQVAAYRLIGYENRILAAQDFNDDTKDAGEIGAGHTVTALYELVPAGEEVSTAPPIDELKYQKQVEPTDAAESNELLTLKLRYKQPTGDVSKLLEFPLKDTDQAFNATDRDYQFAAAVASFGMLLRNSKYKGDATYASVLEIATPAAADDASGYRREFLELVRKAGRLAGETGL